MSSCHAYIRQSRAFRSSLAQRIGERSCAPAGSATAVIESEPMSIAVNLLPSCTDVTWLETPRLGSRTASSLTRDMRIMTDCDCNLRCTPRQSSSLEWRFAWRLQQTLSRTSVRRCKTRKDLLPHTRQHTHTKVGLDKDAKQLRQASEHRKDGGTSSHLQRRWSRLFGIVDAQPVCPAAPGSVQVLHHAPRRVCQRQARLFRGLRLVLRRHCAARDVGHDARTHRLRVGRALRRGRGRVSSGRIARSEETAVLRRGIGLRACCCRCCRCARFG